MHRISMLDGSELPVNKVMAVGRNYAAHAAEMNAAAEPVIFSKPATSLVIPGEPVILPRERGSIHYECELLVWLKDGGTNLKTEEAAALVAAYGLGLDLTLRDIQAEAKAKGRPWTLAKGFDGSMPVSRFVPVGAVDNPDQLEFSFTLNDEVKQKGKVSNMILSIGELLSYISQWITLERGDLILTGTPEGVGPVSPGDNALMVLHNHLEQPLHFS